MKTRLFFRWLKILRWLGYRDRVNAICLAWLLKRGPKIVAEITASTEAFDRAMNRAAAQLRRWNAA